MRFIEPGCFRSCSLCLLKALHEERCMGLVPGQLDFWFKSFQYWMVSLLKIKLNCSWKFWRNWNVPFMFFERSWWARFSGIYLVSFGFRMWEILIFKWFLLLKIQINSKKPGFVGKFSWGCGNTWRLTIQFKHDFLSYLAVQKINTYIAKQCWHVEFPYCVMGSHLGQHHRPH
jgi:hypothetical protein